MIPPGIIYSPLSKVSIQLTIDTTALLSLSLSLSSPGAVDADIHSGAVLCTYRNAAQGPSPPLQGPGHLAASLLPGKKVIFLQLCTSCMCWLYFNVYAYEIYIHVQYTFTRFLNRPR